MANNRYPVACPGCHSKIILRVGIGLELRQPFFYICGQCKAATRAVQCIQYDPVPKAWLELDAGELLSDECDCLQTITIHPDFPALGHVVHELTPFLVQHTILGSQTVLWKQRLEAFRGRVDTNWPAVDRLMTYYVDKNWNRYDAEAAQIYEKSYPTTPSMLQRHDTIHRSIEIIMVPLCVRDNFLEMKQEWVDACIRKCQHPDCMAKFVRSPTNAQEIEELQRDLFHCLGLFVHRRNSVLPALAAEMYPQGTGNAVKAH